MFVPSSNEGGLTEGMPYQHVVLPERKELEVLICDNELKAIGVETMSGVVYCPFCGENIEDVEKLSMIE